MGPVHAEVLANDLLAVVLVEGLHGGLGLEGRKGGREGGEGQTQGMDDRRGTDWREIASKERCIAMGLCYGATGAHGGIDRSRHVNMMPLRGEGGGREANALTNAP